MTSVRLYHFQFHPSALLYQGHRNVKQRASDASAPYEIVRKLQTAESSTANKSSSRPTSSASASASTSAKGKSLARPSSVFSMKNQSMRLQRWGSWIAYEDKQTNTVYWYNHRTKSGQWEKPEKVAKMQAAAAGDTGSGSASDSNKVLYTSTYPACITHNSLIPCQRDNCATHMTYNRYLPII